MSTPVVNPLDLDLTADALRAAGEVPCVAGDDWSLRFQITSGAGGVPLTGALFLMTVKTRAEDPTALVTRRSGAVIPGTSLLQIEIDPDQTFEDTARETGAGWFTVRFSDEDEAAMKAAAGTRVYDIRAKFADGTVRTIAQGSIEILLPLTTPMG